MCRRCIACLTLHLFPYPVPAGGQGSIQHLTLCHVQVNVLANILTSFSTVKELKCHDISPPQEVSQCVHMYSATSHLYQSLFDSVLIIIYRRYNISPCLGTTVL